MSWLWPIRTGQTFFDTWTICHFCVWLVFGYNFVAVYLKRQQIPPVWLALLLAMTMAYAWEFIEAFYLEKHGWVMFKEVWFNRWVSDPLMAILGTALGVFLVKRQ